MKTYTFEHEGKTVTVPSEVVEQIKRDALIDNYNQLQSACLEVCNLEVVNYLKNRDAAYFAERGTTREAVLADEDLINRLVSAHYKNVYKYDCDADWSLVETCDSDPGIRPEGI